MPLRGTWLLIGSCAVLAWPASPRRAAAQSAGGTAATAPEYVAPSVGEGARRPASGGPLDRRVSLDLKDVTLDAALREIGRRSRIELTYSGRVVPLARRVTVQVRNVTAREALATALRGTGVEVREVEGRVILVRAAREDASALSPEGDAAPAPAGNIVGTVTDSATGAPLAGASVVLMGAADPVFTRTSGAGRYALLDVPEGDHRVRVLHLGYVATERRIFVPEGVTVQLDVSLQMAMSRLQEMVSTATGNRRRLELGNDITVLDADSIVATQPIRSVADLLDGRVPGLVRQRTSGAPGDPSRIRVRGASSIMRSNDPIVIVDGVRIYSDQSSTRSDNLAAPNVGFATPSPIDQIDPSSIETIEVLKGPSAATLYGQDAANGVIVITTKKGRAGPPRWTMSLDRGRTEMPGSYPEAYFAWGHLIGDNSPMYCARRDPGCAVDSLVRFQLLNDPELTVLGRGDRTAMTVGVSGGYEALTYSITGNYSDETGLVRLSGVEAERYTADRGAPPPEWMRRPQRYTRWGATTRLSARLGSSADVSIVTMLQRGSQRRSTLESQLADLMGTYFDRASGLYYKADGQFFFPTDELQLNFYRRAEDVATTFTNGASAQWRPRSWLQTSADAGLQLLSRDDRALVPAGLGTFADTLGSIGVARGQSLVGTLNARMTAIAPLPKGFRFQTAFGANYTSTSLQDYSAFARGLVPGTNSIGMATEFDPPSESASEITSFGWYIEPSISHRRFWLSTGLRLDGGSTFGTRVRLPAFPKLSFSYLVSDEPFFPLKRVFNTLRLRVAYGQAGTWPGPDARLRLYRQSSEFVDSPQKEITLGLQSLGNTELKPERSREIEGGFDADLLDDRFSISLTGYRKTRYDALMSMRLPPSVVGDGRSIVRNIGVIRNSGLELSLGAQPIRSDPVTLGTRLNVSRNDNRVLSLAQGVSRFCSTNDGCVAAGYPLFGFWARPILGYADNDGDGMIEAGEVLVADSVAYMGQKVPRYQASLHGTASLFRGAITVGASLDYQDGLTQQNAISGSSRIFSAALNDPDAPLGAQAAAAVMHLTPYGQLETVSALRLNSLSIAFSLPPSQARRFGAEALSLIVQGTNLGLWSDYRGIDPNVSSIAYGNGVLDRGALPTPRTWQVRLNASY